MIIIIRIICPVPLKTIGMCVSTLLLISSLEMPLCMSCQIKEMNQKWYWLLPSQVGYQWKKNCSFFCLYVFIKIDMNKKK